MALIEAIAAELGTSAYIWGGWAPDIYQGRFLREHSDIDCFIVDLYRLFTPFNERLLQESWQVGDPLDGHLLWAKRDGVKLHLGHIEIDAPQKGGVDSNGCIVNWKHNGNHGSIFFPTDWLRKEAVRFLGLEVHVVEPQLGYVLKMNPRLMNPDWTSRDKDRADLEVLRAMLLEKQVDLDSLLLQVKSV